MKRRIRMGQYEFPNPEWAEVSQEGEGASTYDQHDVMAVFWWIGPQLQVPWINDTHF